ncbi:hypothetical protein FRB95_005534 [Tulasnella sp. JGI-2019a]|nr:hypothetical protein FRB95_005534 [Tulasnella sp. JGI-2019a]
MASEEQVNLTPPHRPTSKAIEAFGIILPRIKEEIVKSRRDWDKHEPKMWSRATGITNHQLVGEIDLERDLVEVRAGEVSYGTIIFGKMKVGTNDDQEGFVHIRIHDPPNRGDTDVMFHSIWTDEGNRNADGQPTTWNAIQWRDTPLGWFNE